MLVPSSTQASATGSSTARAQEVSWMRHLLNSTQHFPHLQAAHGETSNWGYSHIEKCLQCCVCMDYRVHAPWLPLRSQISLATLKLILEVDQTFARCALIPYRSLITLCVGFWLFTETMLEAAFWCIVFVQHPYGEKLFNERNSAFLCQVVSE